MKILTPTQKGRPMGREEMAIGWLVILLILVLGGVLLPWLIYC